MLTAISFPDYNVTAANLVGLHSKDGRHPSDVDYLYQDQDSLRTQISSAYRKSLDPARRAHFEHIDNFACSLVEDINDTMVTADDDKGRFLRETDVACALCLSHWNGICPDSGWWLHAI